MDINGDGHLDIFSGSYSRTKVKPMAGLFHVLYGDGEGKFSEAKALNGTDGNPLIIPLPEPRDIATVVCTRPSAVDWDGDGDLDIVSGNFKGTFFYFEGQGDGKFVPLPKKMTFKGGEEMKLPKDYHSDPFPVDWDGDGDIDLLSGSAEGKVFLAVNTAGKGKLPEFESFEMLLDDNPAESIKDITDRRATRVWADDLNGDGKMDLLVGDRFSQTSADGNRMSSGTVWKYLQK